MLHHRKTRKGKLNVITCYDGQRCGL